MPAAIRRFALGIVEPNQPQSRTATPVQETRSASVGDGPLGAGRSLFTIARAWISAAQRDHDGGPPSPWTALHDRDEAHRDEEHRSKRGGQGGQHKDRVPGPAGRVPQPHADADDDRRRQQDPVQVGKAPEHLSASRVDQCQTRLPKGSQPRTTPSPCRPRRLPRPLPPAATKPARSMRRVGRPSVPPSVASSAARRGTSWAYPAYASVRQAIVDRSYAHWAKTVPSSAQIVDHLGTPVWRNTVASITVMETTRATSTGGSQGCSPVASARCLTRSTSRGP